MYLFGLRIIDGRSEKGAGLFVNNALVDISESQISNNQTAGQGSQAVVYTHSTLELVCMVLM